MWSFTADVEAYARAAEPFLPADPVSNAVYRSIGYRPVADYAQVTFAS
ncbi:hypothetical protein [Nonomuraea sp. NPDC048916]